VTRTTSPASSSFVRCDMLAVFHVLTIRADKIGQAGTWISNCAVMLDSLREYNVPHERWEAHLKRRINRGPVFRIVIKRDENPPQQWVFGVLEPQGDNWVWKKKTRDELQALGVPLFERDDSEAQTLV
jgi:hypothetical protein